MLHTIYCVISEFLDSLLEWLWGKYNKNPADRWQRSSFSTVIFILKCIEHLPTATDFLRYFGDFLLTAVGRHESVNYDSPLHFTVLSVLIKTT